MTERSVRPRSTGVPVAHLAVFVVTTLAVSAVVAALTVSDSVGNATTIPIMVTPALVAIVLRRLDGQSVRRTVVGSR